MKKTSWKKRFLAKRKSETLIVFLGSLILSVIIFFPLNKTSTTLLIFKPFWFLETMMQFSDRVGWQKFGEAMVNYKLAGNLVKGALAYLIALGIFWFGNLGTRILKEPLFFRHLKKFKRLSYLEVFLYSIIGMGIIIPTFFVQAGTAWNTIQFMYYSLIFSGVLAGIWLGKFFETQARRTGNVLVRGTVVVLVVTLTIPTTLGTLWYHYLPSRPPAKISREELQALEFLSKQPDGVVLTLPFDKDNEMELFSKKLNINQKYITSISEKYGSKAHHKILVEVSINRVPLKMIFDFCLPKVKRICLADKKLAATYIRGIMAAEGSAKYNKKSCK